MSLANRSSSYIYTADPSNAKHRATFDDLRMIVQIYNRANGTKFRVRRLGRLGPNNPNTVLYRNGGVDGRTYQHIRVADAGYFDIYLTDRYNSWNYNKSIEAERQSLVKTLRSWSNMSNAN